MQFHEVLTSEAEVEAILGKPNQHVLAKEIDHLDDLCLAFIARSPFVLVASYDVAGHLDVSPKGDPPGFVRVLDTQTLAIPERPGNRRADTFRNVLQTPRVGLIFLVPGKGETLRVNGTARIVRDMWLRVQMAVDDRIPELALVVTIEDSLHALHQVHGQIEDVATGYVEREWGALVNRLGNRSCRRRSSDCRGTSPRR